MVDLPDELELSDPQTRVLGCLLEKQATTPDAYPLTLKALTTACNQTSSRDPVVDYDANLVETTCQALKAKGLLRIVHPASGERATKYRQILDEQLGLDAAEKAIIAVLLLRGAQTVPELRSRTERLHAFAGQEEVESVLVALAARTDRPLVRLLERAAGQREARWMQLLQHDADGRAEAAATATTASSGAPGRAAASPGRVDELEARVEALEGRLSQLVAALDGLVELPDPVQQGADPSPATD
ncbi:YceH family protein [Dermatobacter hominis]|uniref:YceH family protein n=1 Tax=Dermatobacter hominis TaxID=2884263 RepID=UPI001D10DA1F|nr:YceH family protein [Dermatobacter hominis]UDY37821.1 YceH family protein [Dermatobacter hominis]